MAGLEGGGDGQPPGFLLMPRCFGRLVRGATAVLEVQTGSVYGVVAFGILVQEGCP